MEKIELLEKLVSVQEMHIELMNDCDYWKNSYKGIEHIKDVIEVENEELKKQIADLKKQIEELQKLIPIEVVDKEQENQ